MFGVLPDSLTDVAYASPPGPDMDRRCDLGVTTESKQGRTPAGRNQGKFPLGAETCCFVKPLASVSNPSISPTLLSRKKSDAHSTSGAIL